MPVDRTWIEGFGWDQPDLYNALTDLADASDANETAAGLDQGNAATPAGPSQWSVTAANGHFRHAITPPTGTPPPAIQYELQSATSQLWDANSSVSDFVLGLGQATLDVVDPGAAKFWRMRWRSLASPWSQWLTYSNSQGVVALASGTLATG